MIARRDRRGSSVQLGGWMCSLTFEHHGDWYEPGYWEVERDPDWVYVDKADHRHTATLEATLDEVREACYCTAVCEPHTVHKRWQCKRCGEHIKPGTRTARGFWMSRSVLLEATIYVDRLKTTTTLSLSTEEAGELHALAMSLRDDQPALAETFGALLFLVDPDRVVRVDREWSG